MAWRFQAAKNAKSAKAVLFRYADIALTKRGFGGLTGVDAVNEPLVFNGETGRAGLWRRRTRNVRR